jgi:hypothetical protein
VWGILFHDFFVVYRVADVDVGFVGEVKDCWVEVEDIGRVSLGMEVDVETLHECCFAGAWEVVSL